MLQKVRDVGGLHVTDALRGVELLGLPQETALEQLLVHLVGPGRGELTKLCARVSRPTTQEELTKSPHVDTRVEEHTRAEERMEHAAAATSILLVHAHTHTMHTERPFDSPATISPHNPPHNSLQL